jgi:multidrug resistance efflux pump
MKLVIRGNSERNIPDEKLQEYLEMGYSEIDSKGNVLQEGKSTDPSKLESFLKEAKSKLAAVESENTSLKSEVEDLKSKLAAVESGNGGEFKCAQCEKSFSREQDLKAHVSKTHPET